MQKRLGHASCNANHGEKRKVFLKYKEKRKQAATLRLTLSSFCLFSSACCLYSFVFLPTLAIPVLGSGSHLPTVFFVAGQHWTEPHNLQLDCGLPLCVCVAATGHSSTWLCAQTVVYVYGNCFSPTPTTPPSSCFGFVPHYYRVCPIRPDYPHFVRLIVGFDFVASARLLWPQFIYLFSTSLSVSLFFSFSTSCLANIVCKCSFLKWIADTLQKLCRIRLIFHICLWIFKIIYIAHF